MSFLRLGPSIGIKLAPRLRLRQAPAIRLRLILACTLCQGEIHGEARSPEKQLEAARTQKNRYDPCIVCGAHVPSWGERAYRGLVDAAIERLEKWRKRMDRKAKKQAASLVWPSDTRSLAGDMWNGDCPSCKNGVEMYLNNQDYFECPSCHLQMHAIGGGPNVMPLKGRGEFKLRHGHYISAVDELPGVGAFIIKHDSRVR